MNVDDIILIHLEVPDRYIWGYTDLTGLIHKRWEDTPYALVLAVHLDDDIVDAITQGPTPEYLDHYHAMNQHLDKVARAIAADLEKEGFKTFVQQASAPSEELSENYQETIRADFSHKMPATRAGLGWIGKTDLLVSTKWGPRLRFVTILADRPMGVSGKPFDESQCGNCSVCVVNCPPQAATGLAWNIHTDRNEYYDPHKCREHCKKTTFERTGKEGTICGICVSVCPRGKQ